MSGMHDAAQPTGTISCSTCNGYGRVNDGSGARSPYGPKCPKCWGSGVVAAQPVPAVPQRVVAYEFLHPNGHAIVDYSEHTHVGHLTADKGYVAHPLVYAGGRWIAVTDRLPTHNYSVLAWIIGGGLVCPGEPGMRDIVSYIEGKGWCQNVGDSDAVVTVSHWQDLPDAPVPPQPAAGS